MITIPILSLTIVSVSVESSDNTNIYVNPGVVNPINIDILAAITRVRSILLQH